MKDIVEMLFESHNVMREKIALGLEYAALMDEKDSGGGIKLVNVKKTMEFLEKNLVQHMEEEEILLDRLAGEYELAPIESEYVTSIFADHKMLLAEFEKCGFYLTKANKEENNK